MDTTMPVLHPFHSPTKDDKNSDDKIQTDSNSPSIMDEKEPYVNEKGTLKHSPSSSEVGEVFADGPRLIDLGEDGKERPIETDFDYAERLISSEDDPSLPVYTFRMWFLGLGLSCFGAVLSQIALFRPEAITVGLLFLQIISYILAKVMEEIIPGPSPTARIKTPDNRFWRFMNPGPFNIKEHVAVTVMASTASQGALAIRVFAAQDLYYNVRPSPAVGIFTLIGSQLVGYGMAGIVRSFLVYPTFAVYPHLIPSVQLFDALHRGRHAILQKKRLKFFWLIFVGIFIWEWFPEYIAPTLTGVSIFCLANQDSAWFTRIFGGAASSEGLGAFSFCFDWAYVGAGGGSLGSLFTPIATMMSFFGGLGLGMIVFCVCYATNAWHAKSFPFLSGLLFNQNGTIYNQLLILNDDFTLNHDKLAQQGLPWYTASYLVYKISRTVNIGAAVTHFCLWHSTTIYGIILKSRKGECDDPHHLKMKVYKEVSNYWYLAIFIGSAGIAVGTGYAAKSGLPWWALFVALFFACVFVPIIGTLHATVGYAPSVETLVQMLASALVPEKPVANMYFSLYGYNSVVQALGLLKDLKLGQYTKLPPRVTFTVQVIGTVIGGLLNFVIMRVVLNSQRDILLQVQGTNVWSGQWVQGFNSAAITWGALGKPLYATGARYGFLPYTLLVGLGVPIPFWLLHKKYPKVGFNLVFTPIVIAEIGYLSGGINSAVFFQFLLSIFSQYYLRRYRSTWFRKYNFLMSAALDGGTAVMIFVYTFAVGGGSGTARPFPHWALNPKGNPDYCKRLT